MGKTGRDNQKLNSKAKEGLSKVLDRLTNETGNEYWQGIKDGISKLTYGMVEKICEDKGIHVGAALNGRLIYADAGLKATNTFWMR